MVALSPASSSNLRAIASECGVIADSPGAYVQVWKRCLLSTSLRPQLPVSL